MRLLALAALSLATLSCRPTDPARPASGPSAPVAPPTTREIDVAGSGVTLRARVVGPASPSSFAVVIHGGPGLSHHYTRPLERLATATRAIVTYDQRGVGGSSPTVAHGLDPHVADLSAIVSAFGAARVDLVGHSWGALLAMAYASREPARVSSLVLVDAVPPSKAAWDRAGERFDARRAALVAEGVVPSLLPLPNGPDCSPRLIALLPVYYADPRHPATKDLAGSSCHTGVNELTWLALGAFDLSPTLAPLTAPTLIVQGAADPFGAEVADDVAAALPSAKPQKVVLPACGHIPWEECGDAFYAAVAGFLSQ